MARTGLTVLVYDVSCDRRRNRLHSLLLQYAMPVQKSAFEGRLTDHELERLLQRAAEILEHEDQLVLYPLPPASEERLRVLGPPRATIEAQTFFII